jgi:DNA-binding MarR family transcriptional regulator
MTAPSHRSRGYQALIQLLRTSDTIWNTSRLFFEHWDLSPSQFNVLNLLAGHPDGMSQTDLGRELIMHRSNVTGLVDRLQARGLVQRLETDSDRRVYRVVLTPAAKRIMEEILPEYHTKAEQVWRGIPQPRLEQILKDLRDAACNAERVAKDSARIIKNGRPYDQHSEQQYSKGRSKPVQPKSSVSGTKPASVDPGAEDGSGS